MEHLRSAPPRSPTAATNFSCSSGVHRNRDLTAAAAAAAAEDGPGLSGYCPPADPVQTRPAEKHSLSIQIYDFGPLSSTGRNKPQVELEQQITHLLLKTLSCMQIIPNNTRESKIILRLPRKNLKAADL